MKRIKKFSFFLHFFFKFFFDGVLEYDLHAINA